MNTVYALELSRKSASSTRKANLPTSRSGLAIETVGSKIYIFGREGDRTNRQTSVFDNVEVYDTKSDKWTVLPPWPLPR